MRPLTFLFLLLLLMSGGMLRAQEQERKLIDRIMKPNTDLSNPLQNMTYYAGSGGGLDTTKNAAIKPFYFDQVFTAKSFETKTYAGTSYWQGNFAFSTKAADVKGYNEENKVYETKGAEAVKSANEAGKGYDTKGYATREADERGKTSQAHLDEVNKGKTVMNMDQVRELLNKNK